MGTVSVHVHPDVPPVIGCAPGVQLLKSPTTTTSVSPLVVARRKVSSATEPFTCLSIAIELLLPRARRHIGVVPVGRTAGEGCVRLGDRTEQHRVEGGDRQQPQD